jgi:hypothetical protein
LIALQTPGKTGIAEIETDNGHSPTQIKFEDGSLIRGFGSGGTFETADHKTYPIDAFRFNIDEVGYMIKDREVHRTFDGSFDVYNRKDHEHFYRQPGQTKWLKEAPELTGLASMFYAKPKDLSVSQDVEEMLNGLIGK